MIRWMPLLGAAKVEGNNIFYTTSIVKLPDGTNAPEVTVMGSNVLFENGEISFKVKFKQVTHPPAEPGA